MSVIQRQAKRGRTPSPPSWEDRVSRGARAALAAVMVTMLVIVVAAVAPPFLTIYRAQKDTEAAAALLDADQPAAAFAKLAELESAVYFHPLSVQEVDRLLIRCLVRMRQIEDAERLARAMLLTPPPVPTPPSLPATAEEASAFLKNWGNWVCNRTLSRLLSDTPPWDRWAGYRALLEELEAGGQQDQFMAVARGILKEYPENPLISYIKGRAGTVARISLDELTGQRTPPPVRPQRPPPPVAPPPAPEAPPAPSHWGVVQPPLAAVYNQKGAVCMRLPAGTLVEVTAFQESRAGIMAVCSFSNESFTVGDLLVRTDDLDLQPGNLASVDDRQKELRIRHARLAVQIARIEGEATAVSTPAPSTAPNPAYAAALAKYEQFRKESERLSAEMEHATGSRRMELMDKLRAMKYEQMRLRRELDAAARKNPAPPPSTPAPAEDPRLAALRQELADVERQLGGSGEGM